MTGTEPVVVFVAQGDLEALQVRAFLEANGVPVAIRGESLRVTHGLTLDGLGRTELLVTAGDAARARELLRRVEDGELALGGELPAEDGLTPPGSSGSCP